MDGGRWGKYLSPSKKKGYGSEKETQLMLICFSSRGNLTQESKTRYSETLLRHSAREYFSGSSFCKNTRATFHGYFGF